MTRPPRFPMVLGRLPGGANQGPAPPASPDLLRPQAPLQHAAQAQLRGQAVARHHTGLGLDSAAVRLRMVQRLRDGGIRHPAVLDAFAQVERHRYVDTALAAQAYEDTSLPIGLSQTISKPSVVARMLSLLMEGASALARGNLGRVLEIGSGCGYQAALLARLSPRVVTVERLKALHEKARAHLEAHGLATVQLVHADGCLGHAPHAPYDSIVAAAGGADLPPAWLDQLAVGGRLVAPLQDSARGGQGLLVVDRHAAGLVRQWHEGVHFVPLKSGAE